MFVVFWFISVFGIVVMLWVGGYFVLINFGEVGLYVLVDMLYVVEYVLELFGGFVVWVVDMIIFVIVGLVWGFVIVGIVFGIVKFFGKKLSFYEGEILFVDIYV